MSARRYRQFIVTLPADVAEQLTADHRALVADAIGRGEAAPDFDRFLEILLDLGRRAVLAPESKEATT